MNEMTKEALNVKKNYPQIPDEICEKIVKSIFFSESNTLRCMVEYPGLAALVRKYSYLMGICKESDEEILMAIQRVYDGVESNNEDAGYTTLEYAGIKLTMPNMLYRAFNNSYANVEFCIEMYLNPHLLLESLEHSFTHSGYKTYTSMFVLMFYDFVITKQKNNNSLNLPNDLYMRLLVTGFKHEDVVSLSTNPEQIDVLLECIGLDELVKQLNDMEASPNDSDYYKNSLKLRTAQVDIAREQVKWLNELKNYLTIGSATQPKNIEEKLSRRFQ